MRTVLFAHSDIHSLTPRLSLSIYSVVQNTTPTNTVSHPALNPPRHPTNASSKPARLRITSLPWVPIVCISHTVYHPFLLSRIRGKALFPGLFSLPQPKTRFHAISLTCLSVSLYFAPRDRISGYTPRARPRALTGLRLPAVGSLSTRFPGRTYGFP